MQSLMNKKAPQQSSKTTQFFPFKKIYYESRFSLILRTSINLHPKIYIHLILIHPSCLILYVYFHCLPPTTTDLSLPQPLPQLNAILSNHPLQMQHIHPPRPQPPYSLLLHHQLLQFLLCWSLYYLSHSLSKSDSGTSHHRNLTSSQHGRKHFHQPVRKFTFTNLHPQPNFVLSSLMLIFSCFFPFLFNYKPR